MPDSSAPEPLFRRQALDARRDSWLGRPRLLQPISVLVAAGLSIAAVALIVGFVAFGTYTRRVRVQGTVVPSAGVTHVFAPRAGRVLGLAVAEGTVVRRDEPLYTLGLDSVTALGETEAGVAVTLRAQRDELVAEIDRHRVLDATDKAELQDQERTLLREIEQVETQIGDATDYTAWLKTLVETYRPLADRHIVVQREFEIRQQNYMQTRDGLGNLRRQRVQLDGTLIGIRARLADFDAKAASAIGELRQRIAAIDQQLTQGEARRAIQVTAPRDGTVTAILAQQGQTVAAGTPLLSILPAEGHPEIQLLAQSNAIGFIREGGRVLLRYAAFPYQKFGHQPGTVTRISRVTLRPGETELMPLIPGQPVPAGLYRITVRPDAETVMAYGKPEPLQAGMAVEADLLLDAWALWKWMLEPLYSLRAAAGTPAETRP
jgi:membrane fusion protein